MERLSNNFLSFEAPRPKPPLRKELVVESSTDDEEPCSVPEIFIPQSRPGSSGSVRALAAAARAAKAANYEAATTGPLESLSVQVDSHHPGLSAMNNTAHNPAGSTASAMKGMAAMNFSDEEEPESSSTFMAASTRRHRMATSAATNTPHAAPSLCTSNPPPRPSSSASRQEQLPPPPQRPPQQPAQWMPSSKRPAAGGPSRDLLVEEVELEDDGAVLTGVGIRGRAGGALRTAALTAAGQPLAPDAARALGAVLWGSPNGLPPDSWKQGFFFCQKRGLQFGLVQSSGGPCGVLAAVQAHILTKLNSAGRCNLSPSAAEQSAALVDALADVLWQARTGAHAVLAVPAPERGMAPGQLGYPQLMRTLVTVQAPSQLALQDQVRSCLPFLASETGWGIVLLLASLVLTRGVEAVRADMDEANCALSAMHGYCTQELVNLILTGRATSNLFDGTRDLDGHQLRGIQSQCRIGFLSLFEWYKNLEVGSRLKNPEAPVWVVCAESHFTVLFAQDSRPLRNLMPFNLMYYDELANQDKPIMLTVCQDPKGGWTARVGDSYTDRGRCEGQNIPPLECVIETRWPGVHVDWNDTEPIL